MNIHSQPLALVSFTSFASFTPVASLISRVKKNLSVLAIAAVAVFGAATASAQSPMSPAERPSAQPGTTEQAPSSPGGMAPNRQPSDQQVSKQFQAADANGDGKLTKEEARTGMPGVYRNFERIDTKGQGFITQEDLMMAMKR
jgi:EF hand